MDINADYAGCPLGPLRTPSPPPWPSPSPSPSPEASPNADALEWALPPPQQRLLPRRVKMPPLSPGHMDVGFPAHRQQVVVPDNAVRDCLLRLQARLERTVGLVVRAVAVPLQYLWAQLARYWGG